MLFDLFACFDFGENKVKSTNPFKEIDPYKKMIFAHQESLSDDAYLVSLHKRHDDNSPVHDDDDFQVRIFGYCFARTDSSYLKDRSRLSANRIAQIFDEHGAAFIEMIKGSFSILIFDKRKKELSVFTDPLNVRPLYYTHYASQLAISSSLAVIVKWMDDAGVEPSINYPALIEYKLFGYILNDDTLLKDVATIPPGASLRFTRDGVVLDVHRNPFEAFGSLEIEHPNEQVAVDRLEAILKKNLELHLFDSDRTCFALTGGLNSRTNLALLENKAKDFLFYTYGNKDSIDIAIANKITTAFNLRSKPVVFDDSFQKGLQKNVDLALGLGDGMSDIRHTYELFAYKEVAKSYDYVMTGFFGNELLTPPVLPNAFINKWMMALLNADDMEASLENIVSAENLKGINEEVLRQNKSAVVQRVLENPLVSNNLDPAKKYFFFMLMVAARKEFMKAVKVEKSFVENLHPFLDIEYIEVLLKTPFSWVHTWKGEPKDSWESDKLYALLIDRNKPRLNNILSTGGYTPKYLLKSRFKPIMKLENLYNKKKISRNENYDFNSNIVDYLTKSLTSLGQDNSSDNQGVADNREKGYIQRNVALNYWLEKNNIS